MATRSRFLWHLFEKYLVALFVLLDGEALIMTAPNDGLWRILVTASAVVLAILSIYNFLTNHPETP